MAYEHRQNGYWAVIMLAIGVVAVGLVLLLRAPTPVAIGVCAGAAILATVGLFFHHLITGDRGDHLLVQFGPIPWRASGSPTPRSLRSSPAAHPRSMAGAFITRPGAAGSGTSGAGTV